MAKTISQADSQAIAIQALTYIAADGEQMNRFVALSGIAPEELRSAAQEPGFLVGVLDFFMGHEPTLMAFAANAGISPEDVTMARHRLAGEPGFE